MLQLVYSICTLRYCMQVSHNYALQVVTVNDYLARRDSEWVGQVHRFLGLQVGLVQQGLNVSPQIAHQLGQTTHVSHLSCIDTIDYSTGLGLLQLCCNASLPLHSS